MGQRCSIANCITNGPSTSATNYLGLTQGVAPWGTTEGQNQCCFGSDSPVVLTDWRVNVGQAPGVGKSWTFTIRQTALGGAAADTAAVITIQDTATSGTWNGSITLTPGDLLGVKSVPSGTPAAGVSATVCISWVTSYVSNAARKAILMVSTGAGQTVVAGTTAYEQVINGGIFTTELNESEPMPCAGTVSSLYFNVDVAPSAGKNIVATLRKTPGGITGTVADQTLTATISGTNTSASDTTNSVHFNAGDIIGMKIVNDTGSSSLRPRFGMLFQPDQDGVCMWVHGATAAQSSTTYTWNGGAPNATVGLRQGLVFASRLKCLSAMSTKSTFAALTSGDVAVNTLAVNGTATALTTTITSDGTLSTASGSDTSHEVVLATDDLISFKTVLGPSSTTCTTQMGVGFDFGPTYAKNALMMGMGA